MSGALCGLRGRKDPGLMGKSSRETDLGSTAGRAFTQLEKMNGSWSSESPSQIRLVRGAQPLGKAGVGDEPHVSIHPGGLSGSLRPRLHSPAVPFWGGCHPFAPYAGNVSHSVPLSCGLFLPAHASAFSVSASPQEALPFLMLVILYSVLIPCPVFTALISAQT